MLQVWHAVGRDGKPLRKRYLEAILPPFVGILRRWRPLLAGIHELATADGLNPLIVDDRALAADALPIEVINNYPSYISACWLHPLSGLKRVVNGCPGTSFHLSTFVL